MHLYQLNPTSKRPTVRWMTFNKSKFSTVQNCFWSLNSSRATMEKKGYTHPNKVNLYSLNIKEWFWRKRTIKPGDIIFQFQWKTNNFWGLAFKPAICSQSLGISKKGHIYIYIHIYPWPQNIYCACNWLGVAAWSRQWVNTPIPQGLQRHPTLELRILQYEHVRNHCITIQCLHL